MFDTGSTAFILVSAALVMLMTPGLAFFYGGLVGRKNTMTIMMQSFVSLGWTTIIWVTVGFTMCFGNDVGGIIGDGKYLFLNNVSLNSALDADHNIPILAFLLFQMMTATITPALITGAFADRVKFKAYLLFLTLWLLLVYFPLVHMVWGGGILQDWGVLDFAGGIVIHASAGFGALASVFFIGKRKVIHRPHNLPLFALGAALLWFGWYGFNAGGEFKVDEITVLAFANTDISASFAAVTWMFLAWKLDGKPSTVGFFTGALAGLVTITPAAGFVGLREAMLIGVVAGAVGFFAVRFKNMKGWDDSLDVWGIHGMGGFTGILLLGIFASKDINPAGSDGLIYGGGIFFLKEFVAVSAMAAYAFLFTYGMLYLINMFTPVRVPEEEERSGLDIVEHGEETYAL